MRTRAPRRQQWTMIHVRVQNPKGLEGKLLKGPHKNNSGDNIK